VSTIVQICGDYLTVVCNWPVPGLGIRGIAISALCASSCAAAVGLTRLSRSPLSKSLGLLFPAHGQTMRRVLKVGLPTAFQRLSWATSVFVVFFVLSHCPSPTAALASWTIGMRVEALILMPMMALGMGVGAIVGQNLGAREIERAFKAGWHVSWIGIWMMIVMAAGLFCFAHPLAMLMSRDVTTIDYTTWYLRINAMGDPFLALGMILSGALQGAGDTRTPMWITMFSHWGLRLPLAWLLSLTFNLGPTGTWIAMSLSVIIMSLLMTWRYQSRAWIKTEI
jgi:MATE family multidrug resistance protein